jgi:hypothetical protein
MSKCRFCTSLETLPDQFVKDYFLALDNPRIRARTIIEVLSEEHDIIVGEGTMSGHRRGQRCTAFTDELRERVGAPPAPERRI